MHRITQLYLIDLDRLFQNISIYEPPPPRSWCIIDLDGLLSVTLKKPKNQELVAL